MNRSSQCMNKHLHIDFLLEEQSEWRHWQRQTLSKPSEQKLSIFVWLSKCFLQILLEKIFLPLTAATASTLDNRLLLLTNISSFHYHLLGSARFNLQHFPSGGISWYQVVNFLPSRCEHCGPEMRCRCLPSVQQQVPSSQCSPLFCCFWCIRIMSWDFFMCYCNGPKYTELVLDCNELRIESTWLGTIGKEACVDPVEKPRCL